METAQRNEALNQLRMLVEHHRTRRAVHGFSESSTAKSRLRTGIEQIDGVLKGGILRHALHEIRCSHARDAGTAAGFLLALLCRIGDGNPVKAIWVTDPAIAVDNTRPWPDGLSQHGIKPSHFIFVTPKSLKDAMWAADEAAACNEIDALVFNLKGNPRVFDITATRRLMLRTKQNRIFACVLRQGGEEEASAAATRWHVAPRPSSNEEEFKSGIGQMRHVLTLEKNCNGQTGQWLVAWNPHTRSFTHVAPEPAAALPVSRLPNPFVEPDRTQEMGQVLAIKRAS